MSSRLLPDELWNEIEQLFPEYEATPDGGRPPTEVTAVLFVLKTGIGWKDLPTEAFGVSYKTCTRRIDEWTAQGIWQQIHEWFLTKLRGADVLDWSRVLVDCSLVKAPPGGPKPARTRRIGAAQEASTVC